MKTQRVVILDAVLKFMQRHPYLQDAGLLRRSGKYLKLSAQGMDMAEMEQGAWDGRN